MVSIITITNYYELGELTRKNLLSHSSMGLTWISCLSPNQSNLGIVFSFGHDKGNTFLFPDSFLVEFSSAGCGDSCISRTAEDLSQILRPLHSLSTGASSTTQGRCYRWSPFPIYPIHSFVLVTITRKYVCFEGLLKIDLWTP